MRFFADLSAGADNLLSGDGHPGFDLPVIPPFALLDQAASISNCSRDADGYPGRAVRSGVSLFVVLMPPYNLI